MTKHYKHIFFDLDHTLWDFERNAEETKRELFIELKLAERGISSYEAFRNKYVGINTALWSLYREGLIEKDDLNFKRFYDTLCEFGVDDKQLGEAMASGFLEGITNKTYLFPYAQEILDYLYPKYPLYIITNGFEEVQYGKLKNSGLDRYFKSVITSEEAGVKKPDRDIFLFALSKVNALAEDSLMIGDDLEVDVAGAREIGMDQVFVNHNGLKHQEPVTYEIAALRNLEDIL